jgi:hypothetical protein
VGCAAVPALVLNGMLIAPAYCFVWTVAEVLSNNLFGTSNQVLLLRGNGLTRALEHSWPAAMQCMPCAALQELNATSGMWLQALLAARLLSSCQAPILLLL